MCQDPFSTPHAPSPKGSLSRVGEVPPPSVVLQWQKGGKKPVRQQTFTGARTGWTLW